ncbi:MAG TPA: tetratricopeptide repeat protein, partial [Candidatus Eisenbacteria bacterium]|nr:tetratricopeptide repeat protein [Candidatus Eisenbacteria bacterium]
EETEPAGESGLEAAFGEEPPPEAEDGIDPIPELEEPEAGNAKASADMHAPAAEAAESEPDRPEAGAEADETTQERDQTSGGAAAGKKEDLSSLLDDVRNADSAESLAEEITSDVEEDDFRSHYDLGMAYLEMALYTEAIKEFQIASRSDQIRIKSIEMIGHCFLMQNNPRLAVKQLLRGLELVKVANSESLGVHYNLGLAYEMLGDAEKAREHFEEVYIVDISFRDIAEKMKKLSTVS